MPIPVMHGKLPIHGFRVDNLAYITDASAISEHSMSLLQGLEVLVLNALRPSRITVIFPCQKRWKWPKR